MTIETEIRRKVITHLVEKIFVPKIVISLNEFMLDYDKKVQYRIEYAKMTGYDIGIAQPTVMNIRKESEELFENLMATFSKQDEKKS